MSTNSTIIVRVNPEERHQIYCHWDGYPEHVGFILAKYYNSLERAEKLVSLGDLSSLAKNIEPTDKNTIHNFENKQKYVCVYYGRDRGEDGVEKIILKNSDEQEVQQYNYYFNGNQWFCQGKIMNYDQKKDQLILTDIKTDEKIEYDNTYKI